ncbi:hypothetical protein [Streptomyces sp. CA-146814]
MTTFTNSLGLRKPKKALQLFREQHGPMEGWSATTSSTCWTCSSS